MMKLGKLIPCGLLALTVLASAAVPISAETEPAPAEVQIVQEQTQENAKEAPSAEVKAARRKRRKKILRNWRRHVHRVRKARAEKKQAEAGTEAAVTEGAQTAEADAARPARKHSETSPKRHKSGSKKDRVKAESPAETEIETAAKNG